MMEVVGEKDALLVPGPQGMRLRYYSDGGFPNCFITIGGGDSVARLKPAATWLDAQRLFAHRHPEDLNTASVRQQLHGFDVVWCWTTNASVVIPGVLGDRYRVERVVTLVLPGGQFGAERSLKLACYRRIGSANM